MVKITAIKEALKAFFKPATTKYPHGPPSHMPPGLRGLPQFNDENCIGCGACVACCSANAISMKDEEDSRTLRIFYPRCVFCGRCEDICPEDGVSLTEQFELATTDKKDAEVKIEFKLVRCSQCGDAISTRKHLDKIEERILANVDASVKEEVARDLPKYKTLCGECRKKRSYELNTHTQKFYTRRWET
ncbi:MAG: 4Fe-4S dicluster domain-containing protein [Promethearchaeota archaeon]